MRKLRGALLLLAALLALSGGALADDASAWTPTEEIEVWSEETENLTLLGAGRELTGDESFSGLYYDQLGADGQALYRAVAEQTRLLLEGEVEPVVRTVAGHDTAYLPAVAEGMQNVTKDNYTDVAAQAISAYWKDNPRERVLFSGTYSWYVWSPTSSWQGGTFVRNGTVYANRLPIHIALMDGDNAGRVSRLDAAVEAFYEAFAADGMEDADELYQYRYIHDFLCETCDYNHDATSGANSGSERYLMAHRAYGALVELEYGTDDGRGSVVCEGYSQAFQLLCQRVGLPCAVVDGDGGMKYVSLSSNHAWNVIRLDGAWYAVDVTWDDGESSAYFTGGNGTLVATLQYGWRYTYFADNRYFTAHEGEPAQNHAAMSQNTFSSASEDWELQPPALALNDVEETSDWSAPSFDVYLEDGASVYALNGMLSSGTNRLTEARTAIIHFPCVFAADRALTVPDGMTYRLTPTGETAAIRRASGYHGALLTVAAGGTLELDGVVLDGEDAASNAALLALADGSADKHAVAALTSGALTGGHGRALDAGANARVLLSDGFALTGNLADDASSALRLADGACLALDGRPFAADGVTERSVNVASLWSDDAGVHAAVLCQEDAALVCAAYDEYGRMRGASSMTVEAGVHTCDFSALGGGVTLRLFALRPDMLSPLTSVFEEALP